jgi:uncharacterized membrane protein (DUF4010 family)
LTAHRQTALIAIPVAHAGHVLVDMLTFAPVLVLVGWFVVVAIRDRRKTRGSDPNP